MILKLPRRGRLWIGLGVIALALLMLTPLFTQKLLNAPASGAGMPARPQAGEVIHEPPPPMPPPAATSLLKKSTVFTVYGRAFGRAPILGHFGTYKDLDMMAADIPRTSENKKTFSERNKKVQ